MPPASSARRFNRLLGPIRIWQVPRPSSRRAPRAEGRRRRRRVGGRRLCSRKPLSRKPPLGSASCASGRCSSGATCGCLRGRHTGSKSSSSSLCCEGRAPGMGTRAGRAVRDEGDAWSLGVDREAHATASRGGTADSSGAMLCVPRICAALRAVRRRIPGLVRVGVQGCACSLPPPQLSATGACLFIVTCVCCVRASSSRIP